ncbi:MAG: LacI family DNA-binding transcriptional regulator [Candidatus Planktophila sp.]
MISLPPTDREFEQILGLGIPVSLLGIPDSRCSSVAIDDVKGAEIAAQHLIDMGHRDIAIMVGQKEHAFNFKVATQRRDGFMKVLAENEVDFDPRNELIADFDSHTAELVMDEFLTRKNLPTAIFCESDEMAFGVIKSIRKKGLRIPEDISVIGYDDHEYAGILGLTTIAQPVQFLGQLAASQIMARIGKPESNTAQMRVPVSLVIRESVKNLL